MIVVLAALALFVSSAYALAEHGQQDCTACHSSGSPHSIDDSVNAWNRCSSCHGNEDTALSNSVHANVGCQACHGVLHVSEHTGDGAWLYTYRANIQTLPVSKPPSSTPGQGWTLDAKTWYYDTSNFTSKLGTVPNAGTIYVAFSSPTGTVWGANQEYMVCFNCHFLTSNPAEAGTVRFIGGVALIGIPEYTLKLQPHTISENVYVTSSDSGDGLLKLLSPMLVIVSALGILLIVTRRRL